MTVKELRTALTVFDDDLEVVIEYEEPTKFSAAYKIVAARMWRAKWFSGEGETNQDCVVLS